MRASDLGSLTSVSRAELHPDGDRVVVSVTHPSLEADATVGQLFSVRLDGSGVRRITRGFRDTAASFSPDGSTLAFLRAAPGAAPQLHVMDATGGEPIALTEQKLGVSAFRWAPDSSSIVFVSRVPEQGRYGTVEGLDAPAEPARRILGLQYKANGLGYTNDRHPHLFSVAVPSVQDEPRYPAAPSATAEPSQDSLIPPATRLTFGDFDHSHPRFIGDSVAFVSARHETRDTDLFSQIWVLDGGGHPQPLIDPVLSIDTFEVADDLSIFLIAQEVGEGLDFVARNSGLFYLVDGQPTRLTDAESIDLTESAIELATGPASGGALVITRERGTRQLLVVNTDGTATALSSGAVEIESAVASGAASVVSYSAPDTVGDVAIIRDGSFERLTDFSAELRSRGLLAAKELVVTGRDGTDIHGWVVAPEGPGPHPTLLMIHGGPFAAYSVHAFDEPQVYADAGYAVVFCNPRGSAGYGQEHGRAIRGQMGTLDLHDVLDYLDGALDATPELDHSRLGILGGSYGGYLTAWTIAHDHRFAAAIVERGFLDPETFVGTSDIGWFFGQEYVGTDHDQVRAQSPQAVADRVQTPTLVIHSENDLRCPLGQAETYYATLKIAGVDAEMLIFPGEDHELSRAGRPSHRVQRFDAILDWFGRYL